MSKKIILILLFVLLFNILSFVIYFPFIHLNLFKISFIENPLNIELSIKIIKLIIVIILLWFLRKKLTFNENKINIKQVIYGILIFILWYVLNDFFLSIVSRDVMIIKKILDGHPILFDIKNFTTLVLLSPVVEELFYRKIMVSYLIPNSNAEIKKIWFYIIFISLIFAFMHKNFQWYNLLSHFIFSVIITLYYYKHRNIVLVIALHMLINILPVIYGQTNF